MNIHNYLYNLNTEEIYDVFFNEIMQVVINKIGMKGIISELESWLDYEVAHNDELEDEQLESFKRDLKKLERCKLEN